MNLIELLKQRDSQVQLLNRFVYITALKKGYNPSTLVLDAPYVVDQGPGLPKWKPANYTKEFYGLNTMRTGIEKSRNLVTIRLADKIGMKEILSTVKDFKLGDLCRSKTFYGFGFRPCYSM